MVTDKQLEANKENAQLGGVKTPEGKTVSKYNALKHGLLSQQVLKKGEDEVPLLELQKRLRNELKPLTELEHLLVDRIAANIWRLRRALGFEASIMYEYSGETGLKKAADTFFRYETMLERGIYKALHELQRIQAARQGEKPPLPIAIDLDISKHED